MKYTLHDLEIVTVGDATTFNCSHTVGQGLAVKGENIEFLPGTKQFSHYALAALIPFLAAKQRPGSPADWMQFESEIACPDPLCGARFQFKQVKKHEYDYTPIA